MCNQLGTVWHISGHLTRSVGVIYLLRIHHIGRRGVTDLRPSVAPLVVTGDVTLMLTLSRLIFAVALQTVVLLNVARFIGYRRLLPCASSA